MWEDRYSHMLILSFVVASAAHTGAALGPSACCCTTASATSVRRNVIKKMASFWRGSSKSVLQRALFQSRDIVSSLSEAFTIMLGARHHLLL